MTNLPSGTVTFLFTDIEGSTKLAQQYPAAMPDLLARHHAILHKAIEANHGYVFQIIGDAFCAAFHTAPDALQAALDAQRGLHREAWDPAPVKVRMGINTGIAQIGNTDDRSGGYIGYSTLARAQRVMSSGHGEQILLSNTCAELVRGELPLNVSLLDMGEQRLKGLLNPEHLWQVNAPDLPQDFPPLQSLGAVPNNLPIQLTSFVGREKEIAEVKQELEVHRLVTLTGSGGTGKTRLSLQVAAELLDHFDHGVWFVELAPLADPELIPQEVLSVFGLNEQPDKTPLKLLENYLREKKLLLIFDNCEHLIEASAKIANALLSAAPNIKMLASSREALGVKGELAWRVPSLSLPDPRHLPAVEQLSQYEAVRLFIDRASLVAPHFDVNTENAPAIAQICFRLDGIPLAIELAAARVKMLSVEQIAKRLDDRFRLLTGGARTALPRQQTLRALIDWSYDLLPEQERALLRRFSVFAGGCTLEAAEAVCSAGGLDVMELLAHLVDKSLVNVENENEETRSPAGGSPRYRLLETIRQYAREKLLESGEGEHIRDQHLAYFMELAEQAEPELRRSNQVTWFRRLKHEQDNMRAALSWALEQNVEAGLRLASAQTPYWIDHVAVSEPKEWFSQLLNQPGASISVPARAKALTSQATIAVYGGQISEGIRRSEESLELQRKLGDRKGEADNLYLLGVLYSFMNDLRKGRLFLNQSLEIYTELQDKVGMADILTFMGGAASDNKDDRQARSYLEQGLVLHREVGNLDGIGWCLGLLGRLEMWSGDFVRARQFLEGALAVQRQLETHDILETLDTLGDLAYHEGDFVGARLQLEECRLRAQELGRELMANWAIVGLGYIALRQGDQVLARQLFIEGQKRFAQLASTIGVIYALEGLASLAVAQNRYDQAVRIFAWTDTAREEMDDHRPPVEQAWVNRDFETIRSHLDETAIEAASAAGHSMTMEQAVEFALEGTHD
jgi:predicted ATPase/class 3 adenylate cyclase